MPVYAAILLSWPRAARRSRPLPPRKAIRRPLSRTGRILAAEYAGSIPGSAEPPARPFQPDDARLCDVSFVDPQHGWAVGDYGVILHTDDGGRHWSPQASGVKCTLNSVCFVDARNGWAAGGMAWPYLHDTSGVVLGTCDGGLTWRREPVLLPALRKIRFVTDRQGWAIGGSSAMYPGGAFIPATADEAGSRPAKAARAG